jgi:uncharacterized Rmd1/YagE family protein
MMTTTTPTDEMRCSTYCTAKAYDLLSLFPLLQKNYKCRFYRDVIHAHHSENAWDAFYFSYGVAVFWNFPLDEERHQLLLIKRCEETPLKEGSDDEFAFEYGEQQTIFQDVITLTEESPLQKLAVSHGIAQSLKLIMFEESIQKTISNTKHLPEDLARKGKISLRRKEISQKMGQLFIERNSVNLHFDILDTPEIFWEYDEVEPLYKITRHYLDIPTRVEVLNQRLNIVNELFQMLSNELNHQHSSKLEWIIIILIFIEVLLYLGKDIFHFI